MAIMAIMASIMAIMASCFCGLRIKLFICLLGTYRDSSCLLLSPVSCLLHTHRNIVHFIKQVQSYGTRLVQSLGLYHPPSYLLVLTLDMLLFSLIRSHLNLRPVTQSFHQGKKGIPQPDGGTLVTLPT